MKPYSLFVIALLLAPSAWAQEPSFDLKSDAIRKIVHATAAAQSVPIQLAESKPVAKPIARKIDLGSDEVRPPEVPVKKNPPRRAPPESDGFVSQVFEILVESALGSEDAPMEWLACGPSNAGTTPEGYPKCRVVSQ